MTAKTDQQILILPLKKNDKLGNRRINWCILQIHRNLQRSIKVSPFLIGYILRMESQVIFLFIKKKSGSNVSKSYILVTIRKL